MSRFIVSKAFSATDESADELAIAVARNTQSVADIETLIGLAGPNEALQLLADGPSWAQLIFAYIGTKTFEGFVSQFGAEVASGVINKFRNKSDDNFKDTSEDMDAEQFGKDICNIALGNKNHQTFSITVPLGQYSRNMGFELSQTLTGADEADQVTLFRMAMALAVIQRHLRNKDGMSLNGPTNPDCSISVTLNDNGTFGGEYDYSYFRLNNEGSNNTGSNKYGFSERYKHTLLFDATGSCLVDKFEKIEP